MDKLANLRYYFEIISIPIFAYFVIHLVGHGFLSLQDVHHTHAHHGDHATFFSPDFFAGVAGLVVFTAIWNLKFMKKFVPCSHDHCLSRQDIRRCSEQRGICDRASDLGEPWC